MYRPYHKKRICAVCGTEYQPKNSRRVYCSPLCRWRAFSMRKAGEIAGIGELSTQYERVSDPDGKPTEITGNANAKQLQTNAGPTDNSGKQTQIQPNKKGSLIPTQTNGEQTEKANAFPAETNGTQMQTNANPTQTDGAQYDEKAQDRSVSDLAEQTQSDEIVQDKWVSDPFISAISEIVNERGNDERFINPSQYWPAEQAGIIAKINTYLRCLLANTLKLSRYRRIPAADLLNITNGYAHVLNSHDFENSGHPYCETLQKLHKKLSRAYNNFRNNPKLRLVLSMEWKVEIIAMLHEIGNTIPLKKFSELFSSINKHR